MPPITTTANTTMIRLLPISALTCRIGAASTPAKAAKATPPAIVKRLNEALRAAVADPALVKQMQAVGVDLPSPEALQPATVTELIANGLEKDVPALRARGEYLD